MEKAFKKELSEKEQLEPEQLAAIMALYKKRNRPVRRASVVALRNASLKVMQQFKPNSVARGGRKRRASLSDFQPQKKLRDREERQKTTTMW